MPVPQSAQVPAVVAPVAVEYLPALQLVQTEAAPRENAPAKHWEQVVAPGPEDVPAPQSAQVPAVVAPVAVEYLPVMQLVHIETRVVAYFPARHRVHCAGSCETRSLREVLRVQSMQYSYHEVLQSKSHMLVSDPYLNANPPELLQAPSPMIQYQSLW
jgi:hypothetical protein